MKKLVNLLLIVCMVFSVGCAGKQDVGEKSEVADEAETPVVQSHLIEIRKVIEDRDLYISLVHADTDFAGASRKTIKSSYGAGRFSVVDMDSDGEEEVVVEDKCSDIVVFHYEAGEVQYFKFPFRGMKRIKVDGTYESSYSAAVTVKKKLDFNDGMCVQTHLCMYDGTDEKYTIDGIDVSPQEAMDYIDSSNEKQDVEWYEVNKKNLDRLGNIPAFEVEQIKR